MNSLERVVAAIRFEETDRIPVIAPVFGHAAHLFGIQLSKYLKSGKLLAETQIKAREYYGYDTVFAFFDVNVETEAMGSVLNDNPFDYSHISQYAFSSTTDFSSLNLPDLSRAGRIPELLQATRMLRNKYGDTVPVTSYLLGPFNLACQLIGMENALYLAVDDSEAFTALLDFSTEFCISYGTALIESGAHLPILFDVAASSEIIPAAFFREFEMPRLKKIFTRFKAAGSIAGGLFITGNIGPILQYFPETGVDIVNFDYCVSPESVKKHLLRTCVNGNIKPLLFEHGTPADIDAAAQALLSAFKDRRGFILSAGCEIPLRANPETIRAMVDSISEHSGKNIGAG